MGDIEYPHIERDAWGWLRVQECGIRLVQLIADHVYGRSSAEQLVRAHPPLTLGQAHAALAYYYDHQDAVEQELATFDQRWSETLHEVVASAASPYGSGADLG